MAKEIVFVHGLGRKPPLDLYVPRLKRYLEESVGRGIAAENFHVAYWTEAIEPGRQPLTAEEDEYKESGDGSVNFRAYTFREEWSFRARGIAKGVVTRELEDRISRILQPGDGDDPEDIISQVRDVVASFITNEVAGAVYETFVRDVDLYFRQGRRDPVKQVVQDALSALPADSQVCLIGHSMGSFVSLDVILEGTRHIDRLITIGSPLGISVVQAEIGLTDENRAGLKENVTDWFNLYDRLDCVAIDSDLEDDFPEIQPIDRPIQNEFIEKEEGKRNHHKSYGYLRSPELGEVVADFLDD